MGGAQAEAPASVARAAVWEEARAATEQVVGAEAKRLAARTTVVGMGGGTRDIRSVQCWVGSASVHVLWRNWDECRCRRLSRICLESCRMFAHVCFVGENWISQIERTRF